MKNLCLHLQRECRVVSGFNGFFFFHGGEGISRDFLGHDNVYVGAECVHALIFNHLSRRVPAGFIHSRI